MFAMALSLKNVITVREFEEKKPRKAYLPVDQTLSSLDYFQ